MKITYVKGDLFTTTAKHILHGCNDHGVMGSGVAKIIRDKYHEAYDEYVKEYTKNGLFGGQVMVVESNGKKIVNMVTQNFYGKDGKRYAKYDWIADGFYTLNQYCKHTKTEVITMPMIGAGLGGGNWNVIEKIIESESTDFCPVVYKL